MSQADSIIITCRLGFARPRLAPPQFALIETAHFHLFGRLVVEKPHHIIGRFPDRVDIEGRSDHLRRMMNAVSDYIEDLSLGGAHLGVDTRRTSVHTITSELFELASDVTGTAATDSTEGRVA
jgi:hypothetical protein